MSQKGTRNKTKTCWKECIINFLEHHDTKSSKKMVNLRTPCRVYAPPQNYISCDSCNISWYVSTIRQSGSPRTHWCPIEIHPVKIHSVQTPDLSMFKVGSQLQSRPGFRHDHHGKSCEILQKLPFFQNLSCKKKVITLPKNCLKPTTNKKQETPKRWYRPSHPPHRHPPTPPTHDRPTNQPILSRDCSASALRRTWEDETPMGRFTVFFAWN